MDAEAIETAVITEYFSDVPCKLMKSPDTLGRHLVAERDIKQTELVTTSAPILRGLLPSWKKRLCRRCFAMHPTRLAVSCRKCGQAYYCSAKCRDGHAAENASNSPGQVSHSTVCSVLKHFSSCKADSEMQSVAFMCLDAFALKASGKTIGGFDFADILFLQSHAEEFTPRDRREWIKLVNFLLAAMRRAGWEAEVPDSSEVMELIGRITSNNFGMWLLHGGAVAASRQAAAAEMARSSMRAASTGSSEAGSDADKIIGREGGPGGPPLDLGTVQRQPGSGQALSRWPLSNKNLQERQQPGSVADNTTVAGLLPSNSAADFDAGQLGSRTSKGDRPRAGPLSNGKHYSGSRQQGDSQGYVLNTALSSHSEQLEPGEAGLSISGHQSRRSSFGEADRPKVEGQLSDMVLDESEPPGPLGTGAALQEAAAATCDSGSVSESSVSDAGEDKLDSASRLAQVSAAAVPAERPGQFKETLVGRELYIAASYFNHSCEPNCIMTRPFSGQYSRQAGETDACCIRALRDIEAGEHLTISYIDLNQPVSARREDLRRGFYFECCCPRCEHELKNGSAKCSHARSKQGKGEKDFTPKRRGRKARTSK